MLWIIDEIFGLNNYPLLAAVFLPGLMFVAIGMAGVASILWAPFGALICALIARSRGLSPWRCAVAGAVCSTLFFLPWVYLTARISRRDIPIPLITLAYVVLYAAWLQGLFQLSYDEWAERPSYHAVWLCVWVLNMLTMVASLLLLMTPIAERFHIFQRAPWDDAPSRNALIDPVYLLPFALVWGWTVVLIALLALIGRLMG